MHTLSLKVQDDLYNEINVAIARQKIKKSTLIRKALQHYLQQGSALQSGSVLDLAQDLCGVVEGPRDLASHPKHLEGYGQS